MISIDLWFTCHLMKCSTSLVSGLIGLYMYERERDTHTQTERDAATGRERGTDKGERGHKQY